MTFDFSGRRQSPSSGLSRRRFVTGVAAGGAIAGLGLLPWKAAAAASPHGNADVLSGSDFQLSISEAPVNVNGQRRVGTLVNGSLPAPVLRWREGDTVNLHVTNRLPVTSSIHWHGILLPFQMDGVPGLSFNGIQPGETFDYQFKVGQSGTYWYHSHSRFQEQTGVYGAIVVEPRNGERFKAERDYVVLLSDWSDENPEAIFANLKKMADFYNFNQPTAVGFAQGRVEDGHPGGAGQTQDVEPDAHEPDRSVGPDRLHLHLSDERAAPDGNWTALFNRGEKVRLRFINGSSQSIFDVRIPGLKMTVVAADGQHVEPVGVEEFRIAAAETYDVIVEPSDDRAYTVFAQSIDRSGYARGTLTPRAGMVADVPAMDEPQWLSMVDMMGARWQCLAWACTITAAWT